MTCKDKVAIVTGAAGNGMGRSIALTLAREGAKVVINYLTSEDSAEAIVRHIESQGFGLCKEVGHELYMVVTDGILRLAETNKVARDELGALVDQLVEGVLAVGSRFAPDNRPGLPFHLFTGAGNVFSVALHVALLEIGGEA